MTDQTSEQDIVQILRYMVAAWPRQEITEQTVAVYVMQMLRSRLAADVLLLAAIALVDTMAFFPSVAEWRAEAERIEGMRQYWYVTANYRLCGHELPEALRLPAGMGRQVLGYEPEYPELPAGEEPARPVTHKNGSESATVWKQALSDLESQTTRMTFVRLFQGTTAEEKDDELTVHVGDAASQAWLADRYHALVERTVSGIAGRPMVVRFVVAGGVS